MKTMYRGGTISANGRMAVITFRSGWGHPGDWDIEFYRENTPCATLTLHEEKTTYEDVIKLGLDFTGYDDIALEKDMAFVAASREKILIEANDLSTACSQNLSFDSIVSQLVQINNVAGGLSDHCLRIETHIAVYWALRMESR